MKTSTIYFYAVGLNEQNLAFNKTAFEQILAAGKFIDGENNERSITLNQPVAFGASFQISAANYSIFKSATYIKIVNVDTNTETRFGFINNFLELANGNFSVSYTLDDYTNFILYASEMGVSPHIDAFVERANVPLIDNQIKFNSGLMPLKGQQEDKNGFKNVSSAPFSKPTGHGIALPAGYTCAVYFIREPNYNGNPTGALAHGTVLDIDVSQEDNPTPFRRVRRDNSNIYYMVYDASGYNIGIYGKNNENDNYTEIIPRGNLKIWDADDSTIEKIMYFDYVPTDDPVRWHRGFQQITYNGLTIWAICVGGTTENNLKLQLADICHQTDGRYYKALYITNFAPLMVANISDFNIIHDGTTITKQNTYINYLNNSLYRYIDEFRNIKLKFLTAEINLPVYYLRNSTQFYIGISGDGETIILKIYNPDLPENLRTNIFSATGQNINYFDLVQVRDFKAYKNAKITGAAGVAATAIGSVVALGSSIATGNVAGVVGSLSGGAQGIISGIQKLESLSPTEQSPANGDKSLTEIINDGDYKLYLIETKNAPAAEITFARYLEENGALVSMAFDEYMAGCQMEAFNAVKCSYMEITGIPQQAARRIADAFIGGLTLWTATDVGNKKVINYPI